MHANLLTLYEDEHVSAWNLPAELPLKLRNEDQLGLEVLVCAQ